MCQNIKNKKGEFLMEQEKLLLDVNEKPKVAKWIILAIQHVFAMFGATILVPILVNRSSRRRGINHTSCFSNFRNWDSNIHTMYQRKIASIFRKFICLYCTTSSSLFKRRNSRSNDRSYDSRINLYFICYYC